MQPGRLEPVEKIGEASHYDASFHFSHPYFVFSFGPVPPAASAGPWEDRRTPAAAGHTSSALISAASARNTGNTCSCSMATVPRSTCIPTFSAATTRPS